ncbi:hypothetical protein EBB56_13390 [Halomonas sp. YLB-10]|uniref:phage minor head protein n=1 Tax=Halomonas sp. YLB-10 TaxID=2483111 RepID=UPI000F5EEC33|nr:phage minor head protein [Halomonas sp. YLB-10]RQW70338.1 hypothetical protein EBB56_13390 [Halomonas sp. YLB-10]
MAISHGSLPFQQQIDYFRGKLNLPTRSWSDLYAQEHDQAFVVAGAMKRDLIGELRGAVERAIAEGGTLEQFRTDFDRIVERHGWQYNGGRGWRTRVIWETNLRQSYNAGRETQMADPELRQRRPYGLYRHGDSRNPHPLHLAWDGMELPLDDPWWATHTPQNGWGCSCKKFMIGPRDVERMGLSVTEQSPPVEPEERTIGQRSPNGPRTLQVPKGIDPGFEHAPGRSRLDAAVPRPLETRVADASPGIPDHRARDELPAPRLMPNTPPTTETEAIDGLLAAFGAGERPAVFRDALGDGFAISRQLFQTHPSAAPMLPEGVPAGLIPALTEALRSPDEIWARLEWLPDSQQAVATWRALSSTVRLSWLPSNSAAMAGRASRSATRPVPPRPCAWACGSIGGNDGRCILRHQPRFAAGRGQALRAR